MRRRELLALIGAMVVPCSLRARADSSTTVAFVLPVAPVAEMAGPDPILPPARAFVHTLRALGWVEGRNVSIERRSAEGRLERAVEIFAELKERDVNVVAVGGGAPWLIEAARHAMSATPLVAIFAEDPLASGIVTSLAQPGGQITGVSTTTGPDILGKRMQLLKEMAPAVSRMAFLGTTAAWESYQPEFETILVPLERADQFREALDTILRVRAEGLMVQGGPIAYVNAQRIVEFSAEHRIPTIYPFREAVEAGGLMSYGPSVPDLFAQLAGFVDRVLRGSRPAEMPIEQPTRFEMVVNAETARTLGIATPSSIVLRADEVIE